MRATGVVRRIDDLGRIVIPKEIRKTLRMRESSPLEIFTDKDTVILKSYAPFVSLEDFAHEYVESLQETFQCIAVVTDETQVIAVAGGSKKAFLGKQNGDEIKEIMTQGEHSLFKQQNASDLFQGLEEKYSSYVISSIGNEQGLIGSIVLLEKKEPLDEKALASAKIASLFLGRKMKTETKTR